MANLNKSALSSASSSTFTDNTSGLITPALHRTYNTNTIDSFLTSKDASELEAVILESKSSDKASASTVDLSTADGNLVHITGGTTILGFGTVQAGARFVLVFDSILILTYNATSLILPTSASITTAAGDTAFMISEGSGNWRCVAYQRADGTALVGGGGGSGTVTTSGTSLTGEMTKFSGATVITKATAGTDYVDVGSVVGNGQTMNTARMLGRTSASSGPIEEITVGSGLTLSGGTLTNTATPTPLGYFGQAFDYNNQTATTNNIGVPIIFGTSDLSNGVTVVSNGTALTRITFANTGIYNLQFSVQLQNLANAPEDVHIWLRLNGADVVGSTGVIGMQSRKSAGNASHTITGWNYLLDVIGGQYYELIWATTDVANVEIQFYASTVNHPSTASTLFTVTQQSGIMAGTGLTALNGLSAITEPVQVFAIGFDSVSGDWFIDSTGDTHVFNIPSATTVTRGLLTAADWVTFDSKYDNPLGTISQYIRGDGTFASLPAVVQAAASDETTALTTGVGKVTFRMPYAMTLTGIRASLTTAQASGSLLTVDVNQNGTSILSTKLTFDNTEKTTVTAATQPVISTSALTDDAEITIDIDQIGTSGAAGLKITLIGTRS
jgi:hypothetical protein